MRKKMALLLVLAMIVTSSITVPFVSFADDGNTPKKIENVYGAESAVGATPVKSQDGLKYSAEYTYSPKWNSKIILDAPTLDVDVEEVTPVDPTPTDPPVQPDSIAPSEEGGDPAVKHVSLTPTITVKDGEGNIVNPVVDPVDPAPVAPGTDTATVTPSTEQLYALLKDGQYTITLEYISESKILSEFSDKKIINLIIKAATDSDSLEIGTVAEPKILDIKDVDNEELWYSVAVNNYNEDRGTVFSLLSGDETATAGTKAGYVAEIYYEKNLLGKSEWNEDNAMMFECPLILATGTYYIKLTPEAVTENKTNLKLSVTTVSAAEVDANDDTPTSLFNNGGVHDLTLYSFTNRNLSGYWYDITPILSVGTKASYEFSVKFAPEQIGDVAVDFHEGRGLYLMPEESGIAMSEYESNKFYVEFNGGEKYYLRLTPEIEVPKISFTITVKPHECEEIWFASENRGEDYEIAYGCPCGADDSIQATCVINPEFQSPLYYSGVAAVPEPTMEITDWWTPDDKAETEYPAIDLSTAGCYSVEYLNSQGDVVPSIKNVGKYTAVIHFGNDAEGKYKLELLDDYEQTIKIKPAGTTLKSISAAKKAFTVKWNKKTTQVSGYQIQYSTSSKFASGNKSVTITKNTTTSKKISGLKAKKKYYVRIRTYKTVNGTKYYSKWSGYKKVTTKK